MSPSAPVSDLPRCQRPRRPGGQRGRLGLPAGPVPTTATSGSSTACRSGASTARNLSASGVEGFLHCRVHFFVQRVLGIATDEFEDEIDTMAPKDLGTMLHSAFERLVEQSQRRTLPDFGGAWPESALGDLRTWVDGGDVALQAGLTGSAAGVGAHARDCH